MYKRPKGRNRKENQKELKTYPSLLPDACDAAGVDESGRGASSKKMQEGKEI
jgi:hypothetical protein